MNSIRTVEKKKQQRNQFRDPYTSPIYVASYYCSDDSHSNIYERSDKYTLEIEIKGENESKLDKTACLTNNNKLEKLSK